MKRAIMLTAVLSVVGACARSASPTYTWVPTRDGAEDLQAAREACAGEAGSAVSRVAGSVQTTAGLGVFLKCMEEKGWRAAAETPTP